MTLVLEAMALADREYAVEELDGLKPQGDFTIYFMTPKHPNCVLDIFDVWEQKCQAMNMLEAQIEFFGKREQIDEKIRGTKNFGESVGFSYHHRS